MTLNTASWEGRLLLRAYDALEYHIPAQPVNAESSLLRDAYAQCATITQAHSRTFYLASALLPAEQRLAARALYAFCRVSDDLVDCYSEDRQQKLNEWRHRTALAHPPSNNLVALAWADTRAKYQIPLRYAEQLLDGVERDLTAHRYETFNELASYCYGVASTVGLMTMHIVGYTSREAIPYAIKLGVALQLTNILRDVGEDWRNGRLYLPQEELAQFGLTEADIEAGVVDDRWRQFMQFQIARTRQLYAEAMPGIVMLGKQGRFAIASAADLYQAILKEIEANDYDVFHHRAHTSAWQKLTSLPRIWWRYSF